MTPERWQQINELFNSALEHEPAQRAAFLDQACAGDMDLRREVDSLISSHRKLGSFIDAPPFEAAAQMFAKEESELKAGQRIGHYAIISLLGAGGMGEVYLARDTKLGREIALKLLPSPFTKNEDRLRRFEQEARVASALNHPNICMIHEVGETEDHRHYITMEYVNGVTLRQHMVGTRMPVAETLEIATQVGSALAAAHEAGIVHRDIKPENIMLRHDGYIKVLDFGLAKLTESQATDSATATAAQVKTDTGVVIGTSRYMSPEQARGLAVDSRTDIWSWAVVIYEMVTGRAPFGGATTSDVIVSILERQPPPIECDSPAAAAEVQLVVDKGLRKDREQRYQTAKEMAGDLKRLKQKLELESNQGGSKPPESREVSAVPPAVSAPEARLGSRRLAWMASLFTLVIAAGIFLYFTPTSHESTPPIKVLPLIGLPGTQTMPAFSPDGSQVAFAWKRIESPGLEIYTKLVSEGVPRPLTNTGKINFSPVWSPDGQRIAFVRVISTGRAAIFTISAYGEGERKLLSFGLGEERRISWSPDGRFLAFADWDPKQPSCGSAIFLLSLDGLEKRVLTPPSADYQESGPAFSPDSRKVAFLRSSSSGFDLWVVPVSGGEPRRLTFGADAFWTGPTWTEDGRELIFSSQRTGTCALWRVSASGGDPRQLEVGSDDAIEPSIALRGHRLAYMRFPVDVKIYRHVLPEAGSQAIPAAPILASTRADYSAQWSPDGRRIAFLSNRSGNSEEIWVCHADGSNCAQQTSTGIGVCTPRWSPDGKRIAYNSGRKGKTSIYTIDMETREERGLVADPSEEIAPSWSRDGQWIYFGSKRSGSWQIWKVLNSGGTPLQVTKGGGAFPLESSDGRFVYYTGAKAAGVWRVAVDGGEEIPVLEQPMMPQNWAVVDDGIYFIRFDPTATEDGALLFLSLATGRVTEIANLGRAHIAGPGLAVSPDRRSFLYSVWEHQRGDIILVENFH